ALGDLYVRTARLAPAEDAYTQALQLFKRVEDSLGEANTLRGPSATSTSARLDSPPLRTPTSRRSSSTSAWRTHSGEANTLQALGDLYVRTDRLAPAEDAYTQALQLYKRVEDSLGEANTLRALGDLYVRTDRLAPAEDAYTQALQLYKRMEDSLGEANTRKAPGDLYVRTVRLAPAEDAYTQALQLFQRVKDSLGEANTLRALGDLYVHTARFAPAEDAYTQALQLYKRVEDSLGEANTLLALGDLYVRTNRLAPAEKTYTQALQALPARGGPLGEANTLWASETLVRTARFAPAEDAYTQALQLFHRVENSLGRGQHAQAMGRFALGQRRLPEALGLYRRAEAFYRRIHELLGLSNVLAEEAMCRAMLGDTAGAGQGRARGAADRPGGRERLRGGVGERGLSQLQAEPQRPEATPTRQHSPPPKPPAPK
ncbi:MAG: tetratricopeptide repeat protein, partial [Deltaproteobacteria bacterium]|nr:tetratricopeptide repeat protein [Deltaproteobacteria bacterium]